MGAAAATVRRFLDLMEARDLDAARALLAPSFTMVFPGGARFASLEELVAFARPRYRSVRKSYAEVDETPGPSGSTIVYCHGTLAGAWPDGTPFAGIRFIDRFTVRDGKLVDQMVWNDLAEVQKAQGSGSSSGKP